MSKLTPHFLREANRLHFAEKGMLIPEGTSDEDIKAIHFSYFKRLWGNHESLVNARDAFEEAWELRNEL